MMTGNLANVLRFVPSEFEKIAVASASCFLLLGDCRVLFILLPLPVLPLQGKVFLVDPEADADVSITSTMSLS
jgi:hypothetical protein